MQRRDHGGIVGYEPSPLFAEHDIDVIRLMNGCRAGLASRFRRPPLRPRPLGLHRGSGLTTANDKWAQYQAGRVKFHSLELAENLVDVMGLTGERANHMLVESKRQKAKYEKEGKEIMAEARRADEAAEASENRALRFDFGEGLLEIALVVTSLYFISHKKMFPVIGVVAGIAGGVLALIGVFI